MKAKHTYFFCEFCDTPIEDISPPTKEMYESGKIFINSGSILLPESVAKRNTKPGYGVSHSADIAGHYCSYKCLVAKMEQVLNPAQEKVCTCKSESIGVTVEVIKERIHHIYHGTDTDGCEQHDIKYKDWSPSKKDA